MRIFTTGIAIGGLAACVACNGGGGGGGGGGANATTVAQGAIAFIGSASVARTVWNTDSALASFDGMPGAPTDLAPGMLATITGTRGADPATGSAQQVDVDDAVEGPIEVVTVIDADRTELEVAGQIVTVLRDVTFFGGPVDFHFDSMAVDDLVEVWGYLDGDGVVQATRIVQTGVYVGGQPDVSIKGYVSSLDTAPAGGGSFEAAGLTVFYDDADLAGVPNGEAGLDDGDFVGVEGLYDAGSGELTAGLVTIAGPFTSDVGDVELEGIVSNFSDVNSPFRVAAQPVVIQLGASFEPANFANFLADGMLVEVAGSLSGGLLTAQSVGFRDAEARVAAQIFSNTDIDVAAGTVELLQDQAGAGGVPTITVRVDGGTEFVDARDNFSPFGLAQLVGGDYIDVRGIDLGNGVLLANSLVRDFIGDVKLRGRVEGFVATAPTSFTILDSEVPTLGGTTVYSEFPSSVSSEMEFYNFLAANPDALLEATDFQGDGSEADIDRADTVEYEDE